MKKIISIWIVLMSVASTCWAQRLPEAAFAISNIEIDKSTFDDVRNQFGDAEIASRSREDGADKVICYVSRIGNVPVWLQFETGAMGGWKSITAFKLTSSALKKCFPTKVNLHSLQIAGVTLLQNKSQVAKKLNLGNASHKSHWSFQDTFQREATDKEMATFHEQNRQARKILFDVVVIAELQFKNNTLTSIEIKRLTSY